LLSNQIKEVPKASRRTSHIERRSRFRERWSAAVAIDLTVLHLSRDRIQQEILVAARNRRYLGKHELNFDQAAYRVSTDGNACRHSFHRDHRQTLSVTANN
jgi:hypothetical protein